jgi:hypothetical protein
MLARITKQILLITTAVFFFALMAQPVLTKDVFWADRGNRFEGVITDRNVSGGLFQLLGIQVEGAADLDQSASNLTVSFSLPARSVYLPGLEIVPGQDHRRDRSGF